MRTIVEILYKERRETKEKGTYFRTTVLLDDGTEAVGYGEEFSTGDKVEVFFDEKWGVIKCRKPLTK